MQNNQQSVTTEHNTQSHGEKHPQNYREYNYKKHWHYKIRTQYNKPSPKGQNLRKSDTTFDNKTQPETI